MTHWALMWLMVKHLLPGHQDPEAVGWGEGGGGAQLQRLNKAAALTWGGRSKASHNTRCSLHADGLVSFSAPNRAVHLPDEWECPAPTFDRKDSRKCWGQEPRK